MAATTYPEGSGCVFSNRTVAVVHASAANDVHQLCAAHVVKSAPGLVNTHTRCSCEFPHRRCSIWGVQKMAGLEQRLADFPGWSTV